MFIFLGNLKSWQKTLVVCSYDAVITLSAFYLALISRYGSIAPDIIHHQKFITMMLIVSLTQITVFYFMGLYKGIWRYSSTTDLLRVIKASTIAVLSSFMMIFLYTRLELIPRSLFFIQWAYLILGLGGGRFIYRILRDYQLYNNFAPDGRKKILIVGAGAGGEHLCREIKKNNSLGLFVAGFIDDSKTLRNKVLHGIPVLGNTDSLQQVIKSNNIQAIYIAIPSASSSDIRRIYELIKPLEIEIKTLPPINNMLKNKSSLSSLYDIRIEDLLGREEVNLNLDLLQDMIKDKRVLVTGAGGSIGTELCKQIAKFGPSRLVAVDFSEYNIYSLEGTLKSLFSELNFTTLVGDVRDKQSIDSLFEFENPELVLHAAAYKHVPIMEFNPFECIRTNVLGTKNIAELTIKHQVQRFVLVSTDKAVNPTNVMGCTKRIAEMIIQNLQSQTDKTKLMTVRFGNVLGSSGSVIPLFRKQIENGGPLTVTDPEITRFFMSIPEATKLVLQAGAMGSGGELFVLDMGEPIKIIDLAREMISLAGLHESIDIDLKITGLRPGEKLYEEPLCNQESALPTTHQKVKINRARAISNHFETELENLLSLNFKTNRDIYIQTMKNLVPEYIAFGSEEQREENTPSLKIH
ncbi:MAG: nucleoside-diphosphate sugar epimerase/dehydratase [Bdellovibrionota bacterium]|nr:nucleoside-diphosphate sugar epimerase/dehydratase [Bdellovibrionota bacterium]